MGLDKTPLRYVTVDVRHDPWPTKGMGLQTTVLTTPANERTAQESCQQEQLKGRLINSYLSGWPQVITHSPRRTRPIPTDSIRLEQFPSGNCTSATLSARVPLCLCYASENRKENPYSNNSRRIVFVVSPT